MEGTATAALQAAGGAVDDEHKAPKPASGTSFSSTGADSSFKRKLFSRRLGHRRGSGIIIQEIKPKHTERGCCWPRSHRAHCLCRTAVL
jgi:hypothetical protein